MLGKTSTGTNLALSLSLLLLFSNPANASSRKVYNRVVDVEVPCSEKSLRLRTSLDTQVAPPGIQYLRGEEGGVVMVADFPGLWFDQPTTTVSRPSQGISLIRVGKLQSNPPICRITIAVREARLLPRVDFQTRPGFLIVRWNTDNPGLASAQSAAWASENGAGARAIPLVPWGPVQTQSLRATGAYGSPVGAAQSSGSSRPQPSPGTHSAFAVAGVPRFRPLRTAPMFVSHRPVVVHQSPVVASPSPTIFSRYPAGNPISAHPGTGRLRTINAPPALPSQSAAAMNQGAVPNLPYNSQSSSLLGSGVFILGGWPVHQGSGNSRSTGLVANTPAPGMPGSVGTSAPLPGQRLQLPEVQALTGGTDWSVSQRPASSGVGANSSGLNQVSANPGTNPTAASIASSQQSRIGGIGWLSDGLALGIASQGRGSSRSPKWQTTMAQAANLNSSPADAVLAPSTTEPKSLTRKQPRPFDNLTSGSQNRVNSRSNPMTVNQTAPKPDDKSRLASPGIRAQTRVQSGRRGASLTKGATVLGGEPANATGIPTTTERSDSQVKVAVLPGALVNPVPNREGNRMDVAASAQPAAPTVTPVTHNPERVVLFSGYPERVEIRAGSPVSFRGFRLHAPERYVVDVVGSPLLFNTLIPIPEPGSLIKALRVGSPEIRSPASRLILELGDAKVEVNQEPNPGSTVLALTLTRPATSLSELPALPGRQVILDAGHGGSDPGARRADIQEKEITLSIVGKVRKRLESKGIKVTLTRRDDSFVSLADRVTLTNKLRPDVFLSVHINSLETNTSIHGIETYYQNEASQGLAASIHQALLSGLKDTDRSVRKARFYVINHTPVPAVLAEVGFLSNEQERARLISSDYQDQVADALTQGVILYLAQQGNLPKLGQSCPGRAHDSGSTAWVSLKTRGSGDHPDDRALDGTGGIDSGAVAGHRGQASLRALAEAGSNKKMMP